MLTAGDQAPEFELTDTSGGRRLLADGLRRGPLLLAFFALDCQTCEISYLSWDRIHEQYSDAGCELWGISLDSMDEASEFVDRSGVEFPVLVDEGLEVVRGYGAVSTPAMFLIDQDRRVRASHEGFERSALNEMSVVLAEHTGVPAFQVAPGEAPELRPGCTIHGL